MSSALNKNQKIIAVAGGIAIVLLAGGAVAYITGSKDKKDASAGSSNADGAGSQGHTHKDEAASHGHTHGRGTGIRPVSTEPMRPYTKEDLLQYDGVKNPRILVSLKRKVYEVAPQFYGPGADYHVFAGHEATLALACGDITGAKLDKYWAACTEEELATLAHYVETFDSKYPVVGYYVADESYYKRDNVADQRVGASAA